MLAASMPHDYAFWYGYLYVKPDQNSPAEKVHLTRRKADRLFKGMISSVNRLRPVGWLAWYFVRLGWLFGVKYNGKRFFAQPPPVGVILSAVAGLGGLGYFLFSGEQFDERFRLLMIYFTAVYLTFYLFLMLVRRISKARQDAGARFTS